MANQEKQRCIIRDVMLLTDVNSRYDLYFTDNRLAIIFMGKIDRYNNETYKIHSFPSTSSAVSPPLTYVDERTTQLKAVEEELSNMPLDQILKLSKKNSHYTYEEIEELELVWGEEPEFVILSADSESKFELDQEQFKQLFDLLKTLDLLSSRLVVSGNWKQLQELLWAIRCGACGVENELDAVCCVNCGQKIREQPTPEAPGKACVSCGTKNKEGALFCKQCGANTTIKTDNPVTEGNEL